jgi:hypothetical protein
MSSLEVKIASVRGQTLYYTGPDLSEGALPAFFYFSLAGEESLGLDPFNLPVTHLQNIPLRVFSLTLPGHGEGFNKVHGVIYLADQLAAGNNLVHTFVSNCIGVLDELIGSGVVDENKIAAGGLSRGVYFATHFAARDARIGAVLGFAPMTKPTAHSSFQMIKEDPAAIEMNLENLVDYLIGKKFRFYIGNRDITVFTDHCFSFLRKLSEANFASGVRKPPVEMIMSPSIGHQGHGTPPHIFYEGANWIKQELLG